MQRTHLIRLFTFGLIVLLAGAVQAADATGTWKWKFTGQNGREFESTLTLKQDGEKLTGTLARGQQGRSTEISNGSVKNGEVSFTVSAERNGNTFTAKYKGKVEGDTIKGTIETERGGQSRSRDWEAKRS